MATKPLDPAQLADVLRAVEEHGGVSLAARALGINRQTLQSRYQAAKALVPAEDRQAIPKGLPYEREWAVMAKEIGIVRDRYTGPAKPRAQAGRLNIVAVGDLHIPFHDRRALAALLQRETHADICLIGGDFGDAHCASTFTKYEHVSYEEEHAAKVVVLEQLSQAFPVVKYLEGSNHTDRFEKRLRENLSKDMLDAIMSMTGGVLNPDLALVKRFPNVEVAGWKTPAGQSVPWLTVIGDVAFSHAEKYSIVPGAALRKVDDWLDDYKNTLGLPPIRAVVQFHTHAMALLPWKAERLLIEPGCLCQVHGYQLGSRIGGRPQRLGYATMTLVDGKLDPNSVRLRWLDAEFGAAGAA